MKVNMYINSPATSSIVSFAFDGRMCKYRPWKTFPSSSLKAFTACSGMTNVTNPMPVGLLVVLSRGKYVSVRGPYFSNKVCKSSSEQVYVKFRRKSLPDYNYNKIKYNCVKRIWLSFNKWLSPVIQSMVSVIGSSSFMYPMNTSGKGEILEFVGLLLVFLWGWNSPSPHRNLKVWLITVFSKDNLIHESGPPWGNMATSLE